MKRLNVGLIGCGFMGRTHSNAFGLWRTSSMCASSGFEDCVREDRGTREELRITVGL